MSDLSYATGELRLRGKGDGIASHRWLGANTNRDWLQRGRDDGSDFPFRQPGKYNCAKIPFSVS